MLVCVFGCVLAWLFVRVSVFGVCLCVIVRLCLFACLCVLVCVFV